MKRVLIRCLLAFYCIAVSGMCTARPDEKATAFLEPLHRDVETSDDHRLPVPSLAAQRDSLAQVRDIFADNYAAAKTSIDKQRLATLLLNEAKTTRDDTDSWSLLSESMRIAADAGDATSTILAVDTLAAKYRVNSVSLRLDALAAVAAKSKPESAGGIAEAVLALLDEFQATSSESSLTKATSLAIAMAKKSKNPELVARAQKVQAGIRDEQKAAKESAVMIEKLKDFPNDPDVSLEVGEFLCFKRGDWDVGLPLLARASDKTLARLAQLELEANDSSPRLLTIADQWADWAADEKAWTKTGAEEHAYDLYSRVVHSLEGLDRTRVQKRMASLVNGTAGQKIKSKDGPKSISGLVLWLDAADPTSLPLSRGSSENKVDRWRDLSGLGNDALQPDGSKQPLRRSTSVGFSGGEFLSLSKPLPGAAVTVLAVYKATKGTPDTTLASTRTATSSGWMIDHQAGSIWFRSFADGRVGQVALSSASPEGARVFLARMDDSGRLTSQLAGKPAATSEAKIKAQPSPTPLAVGGKTGDSGGGHFTGELLRLVVYSRSISDAEAAALLAWTAKSPPP